MNTVVNVNIGGVPFIIDEDAYKYLNAYMNAIRNHFSREEGSEEIVTDIENRMAELLQEKLGTRKIVNLKDVESATAIMGTPEEFEYTPESEFGHDPNSEDHEKNNKENDNETFKFKTGKRLYKNPDDKVVSGVASGLAAYVGVKDPVLVRLLFVLLTIFGGGSGIPIYIVLMFVLKDAKTAKEKLEMRGEPINLESLSTVVQKEMKQFGDQIKDFTDKSGFNKDGSGFSYKKKQKKNMTNKSTDQANKSADAASASFATQEEEPVSESWDPADLVEQAKEVTRRFGESFEFAVRGFFKIVTPIFMLLGGIMIAALVVAWIAIIFSLIKGAPVIMMFMPTSPTIALLGFINIIFLVLVPIIGLVLLMMRIFFRTKVAGTITAGLFGFWILNVASVSVVGTQVADAYKTPFTVIENLITNPEEVTTLHLKAIRVPMEGVQLGSVSFDENYLFLPPTVITVEKSTDEYVHLLKQQSGKGSTETIAKQSAMALPFEVNRNQDTLTFNDRAKLPVDEKFRGQSVELVLQLPLNKSVSLDENLGKLRFKTSLPGDILYNQALRGKLLTLKADGLKIEEHTTLED